MRKLMDVINAVDYTELRQRLSSDSTLANQGLPLNARELRLAHPLHRICDGVFAQTYSDEQGVEMAKIFLEFGAKVDGNELVENKDTPLIAAASLSADRVGLLYIEHHANIFHPGTHGGTALHWAAWCGRDILVDRLIKEGAEINRLCVDFKSTPLFWAFHGLKANGSDSQGHQLACAKMLLKAGADKNVPNAEGRYISDLLSPADLEAIELLK